MRSATCCSNSAGLDGGEIIKFLVGVATATSSCAARRLHRCPSGRDEQPRAGTGHGRHRGAGTGQISFADETLDLVLRPEPKDASILSLRSPLKIQGSFAAPKAGPDKIALAGRAGAAVALAAINPLLALAATLENGPGKDVNCLTVLNRAATPAISHRLR